MAINCKEPFIVAGAVEGSRHILVNAAGVEDGVEIHFSDTESGLVADEMALIALSEPLQAGQKVTVRISDPNCQVESCAVIVDAIAKGGESCEPEIFPLEDSLTGELICVGIDLYREAHDGQGAYKAGPLVLANCIYCDGDYPNCEEEEE